MDIEGEYFTTLSANNFMCVFGTQNRIKSAIGNDRFKFLLTHDDELCGFEICNLSKNEIKSIQSIQVPYSSGFHE